MSEFVPLEELLERAYRLAYFIHADKKIALRIATGALTKLEVAAAAQYRRMYYTPRGRRSVESQNRHAFRTKVSLNELHLLQHLVLLESGPYERQKEQSANGQSVSEEEMIVYFVKHLVSITVRRNSFHVALGISRLLHDYSTPETMNIYDAVIQAPERMRDGDYFRARKARLMNEVRERFGDAVRVVRGQRGEERFQTQESKPWLASFVEECLGRFAPWGTACPVPAGFNLVEQELRTLSSAGCDPDEEHAVEVNRTHSLLHPGCYRRLTEGLGLNPPDLRLAIPRFFMAGGHSGDGGSKPDRRNAPDLEEGEINSVRIHLGREADRRRAASGAMLRIVIEGSECGRLDLRQSNRTRIELREGTGLVEVVSGFGESEVLLAVHVPSSGLPEKGRDHKQWTMLEGGQRLLFLAQPSASREETRVLDIVYQEADPVRAAIRALGRLTFRVSLVLRSHPIRSVPALTTGLVLAFIAVLAIFAATYLLRRGAPPDAPLVKAPEEQRKDEVPPAPQGERIAEEKKPEPAPSPTSTGPPHRRINRVNVNQLQAMLPRTRPDAELSAPPDGRLPERDAIRALPSDFGSPAKIARVYIETHGPSDLTRKVRELVEKALSTGDEFKIEEGEKADAALKIHASYWWPGARSSDDSFARPGSRKTSLRMSLVNPAGEIIWPLNGRPRTYSGTLTDATLRAVADFVTEMRAK